MFSLFGKKKEEVVAIFDIGNGSIGGALVKISKTDAPLIIYSHREPITFMQHVTSKRLLTNMLKLLKSVSEDLHKNGIEDVKKMTGHHHIHRAYCTFSSPWYVSQTRIIKIDKEKPFIISEAVVNEFIEKEHQQFQDSLKEGKYEKVFGDDVFVFENKIIHTKLNGYEVESPIGKKAREIDISFFSSFISRKIIKQVQDALVRVFHFSSISFSSYALASWNVINDIHPEDKDFIFIDITGEVTDLNLTKDGVLLETVSFPLGRASLIRKIVDGLEVPPEVALSFIEMHGKGKIDKKFAEKFQEIINTSLNAWNTSFIESLKNLQKFHMLPQKIYCTVDADVEKYFLDTLERALPSELSIPNNMVDAHILNSDAVHSYVHHLHEGIRDPFIVIESIFIGKVMKDIL